MRSRRSNSFLEARRRAHPYRTDAEQPVDGQLPERTEPHHSPARGAGRSAATSEAGPARHLVEHRLHVGRLLAGQTHEPAPGLARAASVACCQRNSGSDSPAERGLVGPGLEPLVVRRRSRRAARPIRAEPREERHVLRADTTGTESSWISLSRPITLRMCRDRPDRLVASRRSPAPRAPAVEPGRSTAVHGSGPYCASSSEPAGRVKVPGLASTANPSAMSVAPLASLDLHLVATP